MKKAKELELILIMFTVGIAALSLGCGNEHKGDSTAAGNVMTLKGRLDTTTFHFLAAPGGENGIIMSSQDIISRPANLPAPAANIDSIIAVSSNGTYPATISGLSFSVALPAGTIYMLGFYQGTDLIARLKFDTATDLDSIPVLNASMDVDLGTVSYSASTGLAYGSLSQADLFRAIGITPELAQRVGNMDNELLVQSNLDVNGNGVLDSDEGKKFTFWIVSGGMGSEKMSELSTWSNKDLLTCPGYGYYFKMEPPDQTLPWSSSILISPSDINGGNNKTTDLVFGETSATERTLFFYGLAMGTTPMPPPAGTYIVRSGAQDFTFANVGSSPMDLNLNNVYVPVVRLTSDAEGKVTFVEWKIWIKTGGSWQAATDEELRLLMDKFDVGTIGMGASGLEMVDVSPPIAASGAIAFPHQTVAPLAFEFDYLTVSKYVYTFMWSNL